MNDRTLSEFTTYYEAHKTAIFNYILYRVKFNRDIAEDLTSEIFLKAFEHFDSYDRARSFKTWIFTIAHNHLVNFYIAQKPLLPLDEAIKVVQEVPHGDKVDTHMTISRVMELASNLPDSQRDLVIMRYVNDLSHREIAHITGKEEGAIRTALSRAVASLRTQYSIHYQEKNPQAL